MPWAPQAVAPQGGEAVSVRLGAVVGQPQAQLDGFKTRALRVEARSQRHLYGTEWGAIDVCDGADCVAVVVVCDGSSAGWDAVGSRCEWLARVRDGVVGVLGVFGECLGWRE